MRFDIMIKYVFLIIPFMLIPNVYAFEYYGTIDYFGVDDTPKFCLVNNEEDANYDQDNIKMFERIVKTSLNDWTKELTDYSGGDWKIDYDFVSLIDVDNPVYEKGCDVYIIFIEDIDGGWTSGITGIAEGLDETYIQVVYSHVEWSEGEDGYFYPGYSGFLLEEKWMIPTMKHEMGHAFGLDHYLTNDSLLLEYWNSGLKQPPSIMIETEPSVGYQDITDLDLEKMISLYGEDGFKESKKSIPEWVCNNAKWWASGQISDDEYVNAIQYLIKNGIIHI